MNVIGHLVHKIFGKETDRRTDGHDRLLYTTRYRRSVTSAIRHYDRLLCTGRELSFTVAFCSKSTRFTSTCCGFVVQLVQNYLSKTKWWSLNITGREPVNTDVISDTHVYGTIKEKTFTCQMQRCCLQSFRKLSSVAKADISRPDSNKVSDRWR